MNQNGDTATFTAVKISDSNTIDPAIVLKEIESAEKASVFGTDIHPDQYTTSTELNIRNISKNYIKDVHPAFDVNRADYVIKNTVDASNKDVSFVTDTFKDSMAAWNSALKNNYGMNVRQLGFTKY